MSDKKQSKPPQHWGASAATFYAGCEGETLHIHLETGVVFTGELLGVDKFDLILERAGDGARVLIPKHAIVLVEIVSEHEKGEPS